jgi:hypothetical protein
MKKEKIYEFPIDRPLTPAKRKAVEKHLEENARLSPKPVLYGWEGSDGDVLHIAAEPVEVEVIFQPKSVELYAAAPLWARLLFTKQKKAELKDHIEAILQKVKFVTPPKPKRAKAKSTAARKRNVSKAKSPVARKPKVAEAISVGRARKPKS